MPTGFTAIIEDNPDCTFNEFVWRCVRGLGVCITMRDSSLDTQAPSKFEPDLYYKTRLEAAQQEFYDIQRKSEHDFKLEYDAFYSRLEKEYKDSQKENADKVALYKNIKKQVEDRNPPTEEHEGLKRFMLEQINMSLPYERPEPTAQPFEEWKTEKFKYARNDLDRAKEQWEAEVERARSRTEFIQVLERSIPRPSKQR